MKGLVLLVLAGWCLFWGLLGSAIGRERGRVEFCVWMCLLLGPVGALIALLRDRPPQAEALWRVELEQQMEALRRAAKGSGGTPVPPTETAGGRMNPSGRRVQMANEADEADGVDEERDRAEFARWCRAERGEPPASVG